MTDFTPFTPGEYGEARVLFTDGEHGYPPAVRWLETHGASQLAEAVLTALVQGRQVFPEPDDERQGAFARLASTAESQGWIAASASSGRKGEAGD